MEPQRHQDTKILEVRHSPDEEVGPDTDRTATAIVDAAYRVHSTLGPGLIESVYEACLCHELNKRGLPFQKQVAFRVVYDTIRLDAGLRLDLLVAKSVIVEAQLLSYLKLTGLRLGLLINFNVPVIKHGIKRIIL